MSMVAAELAIGVGAGVASDEATQRLHPSKTGKETEEHLSDIHCTLQNLEKYFANQPITKPDIHKIVNLLNASSVNLSYFLNTKQEYLTLHILVNTACTITFTVPGIGAVPYVFASAPTAGQFPLGQFLRVRFPDKTPMVLTSPALTAGSVFPIMVLYSDELGD